MNTYYSFKEDDKLLNLKVAPMFLDNNISLCMQVNDVTKQNIIQGLVERSKQKMKILKKVSSDMKNPVRMAIKHMDEAMKMMKMNKKVLEEI